MGITIPEVAFSLAIGSIGLAGALMLNSYMLRIVRSTRETGAAVGVLEERVEQLRIANWRQITDPQYVAGTYFASIPKSLAALNGYSEKFTVSAWPDGTACQPLIVEKTPTTASVVRSTGSGLTNQRLAKVDVTVNWKGKDGRNRTREFSTMMSNGGISRVNLPAMGPTSGGASSSDPTAAPGATPTPTPTATPTPTPTSNQNADGRGNIAGEPGIN